MREGLDKQIEDGHDLSKMIGKWVGTLGGHLCRLGSPDVDSKPKKKGGEQELELVDIPANCLSASWLWKPRVLHREMKNVLKLAEGGDGALENCPSVRRVPHDSHDTRTIASSPQILFCWVCGSYHGGAKKRQTQLSAKFQAKCAGPRGVMQEKLRRMRRGHHPVTGRYLGVVRRGGANVVS